MYRACRSVHPEVSADRPPDDLRFRDPLLPSSGLAARKMLRAMRQERAAGPDLKEQLEAKLAECEKSIERLTQAVASGAGEVPALAASIRATEEQRSRIEARLTDLGTPEPDAELTFSQVKEGAMEWREILSRDPLHARRILKKVLDTKLRFTEETRSDTEGFAFSATGSIVKLVSGVVPSRQDSHALVSPTGESWNSLMAWLERLLRFQQWELRKA